MSSNPSTSSTSGGSGGGGGGSSSSGGAAASGPCGACKFLRRKCVVGCVFAPYFDSDQGAAHFAAVHKVFGASNVSKILLHLPVHRRHDAVITICYEAQARLRDPVYGCVSHIFALQQQVVNLQAELAYFQAHLATLEGPTPPPPPPPQTTAFPPGLSINDLTTATASSSLLGPYDLSILEPIVPPSWAMQSPRRQMIDPRPFMNLGATRAPTDLAPTQGNSDFQELVRELFQRPNSESSGPGACKTEGSTLPP